MRRNNNNSHKKNQGTKPKTAVTLTYDYDEGKSPVVTPVQPSKRDASDGAETQGGQTSTSQKPFFQSMSDAVYAFLFGKLHLQIEDCREAIGMTEQALQELQEIHSSMGEHIGDIEAQSLSLYSVAKNLQSDKQRLEFIIATLNKQHPQEITTARQEGYNNGLATGKNEGASSGYEQGKEDGKKEGKMGILQSIKALFSKIINGNDMTTDEALNKIAKELQRVTADLATATQKKASLQREKETAEIERDEAITQKAEALAKVEEMKVLDAVKVQEQLDLANAEKDSLTSKLKESEAREEKLKWQKADSDNTVEQLNNKIEELKSSHRAALENKERELQRIKDEHIEEISTLNAEHATKVGQLKAEHSAEISGLKENHKIAAERLKETHQQAIAIKEKEIQKLKDEYKAEKESLVEAHNQQLEKLNTCHSLEIEALNEQHTAKENSLNAEYTQALNRKNQELASERDAKQRLANTLDAETEEARHKTLSLAGQLVDIASAEDTILPCSDDFTNAAHSKSVELHQGAKALLATLEVLPMGDTPTAWTASVTHVMAELLSDRVSVVNRIVKYYCLSTLPFLIDSQREDGMYFLRKQTKAMYTVLSKILAQCGITLLLPTLFSESTADGDYDTENTFNDVETFCPGSIKQHTEYVERSDATLIVGVSRIGYTLPDGTTERTVVII